MMSLYKMPKSITKKLYVTLGVGRFNFNDINIISFDTTKYTNEGHEEILLLETEITIELPKEITSKADFINVLKKRKMVIEDEHKIHLKEVQDHMDLLLGNDYKATAE